MGSYSVYYSWKHPEFFDWYMKWWEINCENCPYSSHLYPDQDNGSCLAEKLLNILRKKRRVQLYIAMDYHKHQKGMICFLKQNLLDQDQIQRKSDKGRK